jgi:hypothetical protein
MPDDVIVPQSALIDAEVSDVAKAIRRVARRSVARLISPRSERHQFMRFIQATIVSPREHRLLITIEVVVPRVGVLSDHVADPRHEQAVRR